MKLAKHHKQQTTIQPVQRQTAGHPLYKCAFACVCSQQNSMVSTHQASLLAHVAFFTIHPIKHHLPLFPLLDHNTSASVCLCTCVFVFIPLQGPKWLNTSMWCYPLIVSMCYMILFSFFFFITLDTTWYTSQWQSIINSPQNNRIVSSHLTLLWQNPVYPKNEEECPKIE